MEITDQSSFSIRVFLWRTKDCPAYGLVLPISLFSFFFSLLTLFFYRKRGLFFTFTPAFIFFPFVGHVNPSL